MGDTYTYWIEPGDWRPVVAGPQAALLTGREDFDWATAAVSPPADLDGHVGLARTTLRVTPQDGQAVFVRNRLRRFRLTVTAGVYDVDTPPPDPGPGYVEADYVEEGYVE